MADIGALRKAFWVDEKSGRLMWSCDASRMAGLPAGCINQGYVRVKFRGKTIPAHRIVFAITHGRMPSGQIDHIDGDTLNNRPANLRDVSPSENCRNRAKYRTNKSGVCGVSWDKTRRKWAAEITVKGRKTRLGRFDDKSNAIAARASAEHRLGFHQNHGR